MRKQLFYIATAVYVLAAVAFFVIPDAWRNAWICVPTWLLTVACALGRESGSRVAAIALAASAVGDVFGGMSMLLPQMGSFAVAQIIYAVLFARNARFAVRRVVLILFPLLVAGVVSWNALPNVDGVLKWCIVGYMVVIVAMSMGAVFVARKGWWLLAFGAMMFVVSDAIIAWNIFVERVPSALNLIMSTYYVAQGFLGLSILGGVLTRTDKVSAGV